MLIENDFLAGITRFLTRSPKQINHLLEADAELIHIGKDCILAITTDTIIEEINEGLYTDPYQIGWMSATVNFSDLAAVGADPKGFLTSIQITRNTPLFFMQSIMDGMHDACHLNGTYIVGGDTNHCKSIQIGGTAFGIIQDGKTIMRKGCRPGDQLYVSDKLGLGSVYALEILLKNQCDYAFFPRARIKEGKLIRQLGTCCIDTSDGFFSAVSNLMFINKIGIRIRHDINELIHHNYYLTMLNASLPPWFLLAGPHGEFELMFTVSKKLEEELINSASEFGWHPIYVGEITKEPLLKFQLEGTDITCNPDDVANLYEISAGDLDNYIHALLNIHNQWKRQPLKKSEKIAGIMT